MNMLRRRLGFLEILVSSIGSFATLLALTTSSCAMGGKRLDADTAPAINLNYYAFDPVLRAIKYTDEHGDVKDVIFYEEDAIRQFIALPAEHALFLIDIYQTGCRDWRKGAYKKVREWNEQNP